MAGARKRRADRPAAPARRVGATAGPPSGRRHTFGRPDGVPVRGRGPQRPQRHDHRSRQPATGPAARSATSRSSRSRIPCAVVAGHPAGRAPRPTTPASTRRAWTQRSRPPCGFRTTCPPIAQPPCSSCTTGRSTTRSAGFTHYLGAQIAAGAMPPMRVALLGPGRSQRLVLGQPRLRRAPSLPICGPPSRRWHRPASWIGVGVSLGALAMLHAHRPAPGAFGALFLQSGSFFTPELDPQEKQIRRLRRGDRRSSRTVHGGRRIARAGAGRDDLRPGGGEPGQQRAMADALQRPRATPVARRGP